MYVYVPPLSPPQPTTYVCTPSGIKIEMVYVPPSGYLFCAAVCTTTPTPPRDVLGILKEIRCSFGLVN